MKETVLPTLFRAAPILFVFCACVMLAECEDDFGDRAMSFVNDEVHGISRAHVEAELDNIVAQAFGNSLIQLDAETKLAASLAENFSTTAATMDPKTTSSADLFVEFNNLDVQAGTIIRLITQLEANASLIKQIDSTCTDRTIYTALGLGDLGMQGPVAVATAALAQQKAEISVSTTGGNEMPWWVTVGQFAVSLFGANETDKQNDTLKEAIKLVPQKVLHDDEIHEIYVVKCSQILDQLRPEYAAISALTEATRTSLTTTLVAVQAAHAIAEAILRTRDINAFLASTGMTQQLSDAQNLILQGQLWTDVLLELRDLQGRPAQIRQENQCVRALASIENYNDELKEFMTQLQALRPDVASVPELPGKFDQAIELSGKLLASVDEQYRWARSEVCQ